MVDFFISMAPPTVTHQDLRLAIHPRTGKPYLFKSKRLRKAESLFKLALAPHRPPRPFEGGVGLTVVWRFPRGRHKDGSYKITRPDTDNLQKLLKDCMTAVGFWKDDALVVSEIVEKFWAERPGIYICIEELTTLPEAS